VCQKAQRASYTEAAVLIETVVAALVTTAVKVGPATPTPALGMLGMTARASLAWSMAAVTAIAMMLPGMAGARARLASVLTVTTGRVVLLVLPTQPTPKTWMHFVFRPSAGAVRARRGMTCGHYASHSVVFR
jgi:hypothetical protein